MRTRTTIALLVLLSGAGGAYWLVAPHSVDSSASIVSFTEGNKPLDPRFSGNTDTSGLGTDADANTISEENVVRNYGREILRLNAEGQGAKSPIKVPNDQVFSQMIQDEISKPIPVRQYTENDIVVLKATDKQAALTYANAINAASKKTVGMLKSNFIAALVQYVTNNDAQELARHSSALSSYITALLATPVPANWKTFHLQLVNTLEKRLTYANAILDNNDSQLQIAAAINNLSTLVDEEQQLYTTLADITHNANL